MPFNTLFNFGVVGVDLFFVVSGFIILHSTMGKMQTVKDYAFRTYALARIRRIFLPYWPIGLVMAVMTYGFFPYDSLTLRGWVASATLLPVGKTGLNVAWTLQHEVVFYALVALGLFSGWWRIGLVLWSAAILSFWLGNLNAPVGLQPIDLEFLMGIAAWAAWRSENRPTMIATSAALGLLSVLLYTNGANFGFDPSEPIARGSFFCSNPALARECGNGWCISHAARAPISRRCQLLHLYCSRGNAAFGNQVFGRPWLGNHLADDRVYRIGNGDCLSYSGRTGASPPQYSSSCKKLSTPTGSADFHPGN